MNDIFKSLVEADPFSSWWPFILAFLVGIVMTVKTYMGGQMCPSTDKLNDHIVILTGATGGIGQEIAKDLSSRAVSRLILASKDLTKAAKIIKAITKLHGNVVVEVRHLDLRSFDSIRLFVKAIQKDFNKIDVLINSAGGKYSSSERTSDGFEKNIQVNYLGHFLLTLLLLPLLKKAPQGRIINFAAQAYASAKLNADNALSVDENNGSNGFNASKLAVVISTVFLAKKLKGSTITVNALSPGIVRGTGHYERSQITKALCPKIMLFPWMWMFMKTPVQGAQTAIFMAVDQNLKDVSGHIFNDCEKGDVADDAKNEKIANQLYEDSLKALKLTDFKF